MTRPVSVVGWRPDGDQRSLEDLVYERNWQEAARSLEDGDTIPLSVLGAEEALSVSAYLPDWLRMDRVDNHWHISKEGFAQ